MSEQPTPTPPSVPLTLPLSDWPPAWTPRAVVFDLDGTLVDTESEWIQVQDAYLAGHGATMDPLTRRKVTGRSGEAVIVAIAAILEKDPYVVGAELVDAHRSRLGDREALIELPGAIATVRAIARKLPVAIASNSPREMLDHKLRVTGLDEVVDAHVAIEDVQSPKPAPDMYLHAAALLGAEPSQVLAFEDSEAGALAAAAAGVNLIAIPSLEGQQPQAPVVLSSFEDPVLQAWITGWGSGR